MGIAVHAVLSVERCHCQVVLVAVAAPVSVTAPVAVLVPVPTLVAVLSGSVSAAVRVRPVCGAVVDSVTLPEASEMLMFTVMVSSMAVSGPPVLFLPSVTFTVTV